jgi:alginate O-acetyltransferase complex protein AlgI
VLFNSFVFLGFFAAFYPVYLALGSRVRIQNYWLLAASYVFYGYWDLRFLALLLLSTLVDYTIARAIDATADPVARKRLLLGSIAANLGVLGFFKYFGFFADNFMALAHALGLEVSPITLEVVLPVGVSFYTFQSLAYVIDVYRRQSPAFRRLADFAVFVAFFPQLMAGPIERARHLLPQVLGPRRVSAAQAHAGVYLVLWGFFKKVVIADNAGAIANRVFDGYTGYTGLDLVLGAIAFTLQIYGDFSGYSDIARGLAKLLGFDLMVNFKLPYVSETPSEFWQRWHISLSLWLRDYLYIPLGGNRLGEAKTLRNLMLTMLLGGLWHGAAWNYVLWGAFHGALLVGYRRFDRAAARPRGLALRALRVALMFGFVCVGWILFRARSFEQIVYFLSHLGTATSAATAELAAPLLACAAALAAVETLQHVRGDLLAAARLPLPVRVSAYTALLFGIALFAMHEPTEFIYFQF